MISPISLQSRILWNDSILMYPFFFQEAFKLPDFFFFFTIMSVVIAKVSSWNFNWISSSQTADFELLVAHGEFGPAPISAFKASEPSKCGLSVTKETSEIPHLPSIHPSRQTSEQGHNSSPVCSDFCFSRRWPYIGGRTSSQLRRVCQCQVLPFPRIYSALAVTHVLC